MPKYTAPRWAVPAGDLLLPTPGALTRDGLVVLSPDDADTWVEEPRRSQGQLGVQILVDGTPEPQS